ncbi:MAG TPA: magnesium transporter [Polyangiaceae bacterium]|jgi:magnesium transporter
MPPTLSDYPGPALPLDDLRDAWLVLSIADRASGFRILKQADAEEFFLSLSPADMAKLLLALPEKERRVWMRLLPPDDAADLLQSAPAPEREGLSALLDEPTRKEVSALLAYAEDEAGGLMNPRYARVRPDMTVDEAISYLHKQARERVETLYYAYAADEQQRLLGVVSFRQLFVAKSDKKVRDIMVTNVVTVSAELDQEEVSRIFAQNDLMAIPVVDPDGRMKGIVTADDIVDVVQEEATEDIQKFGGMEALEEPYLQIAFVRMAKKRGGWLAALFLGEMLTASAMAYFEDEIARAVVLALFVPLIISSGGNSGSQASTLVIRAMALGEVRIRDWWRVVRRELAVGLALGAMLGVIGFFRIVAWQAVSPIYGPHYLRVAETVFFSLIGVVTFGTLAGSVLPFILRKLGFDPASASAPFVATLVDVTGLVIYFTVGSLMLRGTLL